MAMHPPAAPDTACTAESLSPTIVKKRRDERSEKSGEVGRDGLKR